MKNFIKENKLILSILCFAFFSEYLHVLFEGIPHSNYVNAAGELRTIYLDDMVYYFFNEFFVLFLTVILFVKIKMTKASKSLLTGLIFWFSIEFFEIFFQLFNISNARLFINDGSWIQITTCFCIVLLSFYGRIRYKS